MAQPPAWLRHQAVEASPRAMVSITWKKVMGSVSMPLDERGSRRRNIRASCSLSSRAGGSRRMSSTSFDVASTRGRSASACAITVWSPARSAEVGMSVSKSVLSECRLRAVGGCHQLPVDLLIRFAPGFDAEEIIDHAGHQEPAAEVKERGRNLRQRHIGLEIVAGANDQRQPDRPQDLADAAEAVGRTHTAGLEMRGPDFGAVGPDDRKAAVGEEHRRRQDQPEGGNAEQHGVVVVAGEDDQNARAETQEAATVAPPDPLGQPGERYAPDEAD